jgi:hypothetical protein
MLLAVMTIFIKIAGDEFWHLMNNQINTFLS